MLHLLLASKHVNYNETTFHISKVAVIRPK